MDQPNRVATTARRRAVATLTLVCIGLMATACASTLKPLPEGSATFGGPYHVGPPDQLLVNIQPEPVIDRTVVVRPDGKISIDLVGDVAAAGRTAEEIAADIQERIGKFKRDATVTVSVTTAASVAITVLGEVRNPTVFPLTRETRVVEAIGQVGGPSLFASSSGIRVIRTGDSGTEVYDVDLGAITDGDLSTNVLLRGGDIVYIEPTIFAKVGYAIGQVFFPIQQLMGGGGSIASTIAGGGFAGGGRP